MPGEAVAVMVLFHVLAALIAACLVVGWVWAVIELRRIGREMAQYRKQYTRSDGRRDPASV